jgi:lipid II:glycine glycyltransferase (peptidoglycan interpeptide bridge formation enzyme)
LLDSRKRKGFELSMNQESLENVFAIFPENYSVFTVKNVAELAALAITVEVNPDILYVFYTADDVKFRKFSPVVLLHAGIYDYAKNMNFRILDLGTSSLKGLVNSGVATFKRSLGGIASLKNTWIWRFRANQKSS